MPNDKYYVVWKGRKPGIYTTWEECSSQVNGFTGAKFRSYKNRSDAKKAFSEGPGVKKKSIISNTEFPAFLDPAAPIYHSYCVDASCLGNPGRMEYRCVHTSTREELFHQGPFEKGTNNIGEFLAIVHALALFKSQGWTFPLYTDSKIAMLWVRRNKCKTRLLPDERNAPIFDLIARAEEWLWENDYQTQILHWKTVEWGEIPADFGRKSHYSNPWE